MKQINIVRNTIENGSGMTRLKSRIVSASSRVWLAFAPMLLVVFGLFGVNEMAWATWPTYSGTITQSGSTYYVLNASAEKSVFQTGSYPYDLAGPGAQLTFDAKCTLAAVQNLQVYDGYNVIFDEYVGKYRYVFPAGTMDYVSYGGDGSIVVDALATQVTFRGATAATLYRYFKNVKVKMFSGVLQPKNAANNANITSWTYTTADYAANNSYKDFTVDWSNLASLPISITQRGSSDDRSQFSYSIQSNTQTLGAGKYGTATIRVSYKHDKVGTHSVNVVVGSYTIVFTGTTNKINPYIVTTPTVDTITYDQTISNSQLGTGLVKADLINAAGTVVPGTWTIDEAGQTVSTSGGSNATVHLTFTPTDGNTYNTVQTTASMFVRSVATITWADAYSATMPTIPVNKWIENAASTNAAGATVTYSSTSENIEFNEDHTSFRATGAGEVVVVASHGNTPTHGAASDSKTFNATYKDIQVIVWSDRFDRLTTEMTTKPLVAEVYVENPSTGVRTYSAERTALLEYTSNNSNVVSVSGTTLTIEGKGTTTLRAYVAGDDQYEEASVTMPVKVREPSEGCDDPILLNKVNDGENDYLYCLFSMELSKPELYSEEYPINVAQGQTPGTLSFSHKGEKYSPNILKRYKGSIKAQQKINGAWSEVAKSSVTPTVGEWHDLDNLELDERATHIRFVRPQGGEGYHYVRNVEVTMKHFIRTATPEVDFGNTIKVNSSEYRDVTIHYSNVKDVLSVTNPFASDVTTDDVIDVDSCGAFGDTKLRITYSPTTAGPINDVIVVKDPILKTTCDIRVKADVQRADQTITWNPETNILATESILLNGTTNGQEHGVMNVITYTVTNNDDVISVANNVVTILKPGTVTITATQNGSANYEAADLVEKNFTISAETLTILETPTASDITYGQTLSASTLTGGSVQDSKGNTVAGSFAWQTATTVPNAGDNQNYTVVFTPEENAAWYNTLTTSVAVNVAAAAPVATPSAANIVYGQKVKESELSNEGTEGTWTWTDEKAEDVLAAGTYNDLAVHFTPASGNYTELDATVSLTVEKAAASLSWTTAPTELAYNATGVVYEASSVSDGTISYSIVSGNEYAEIDAEGVLTILVPGQTVTVQATQAEGTNYLAPEAITVNVTIGAAPTTNIFTNATENGDWDDPANWQSGIVPTGDPDIFVTGDLVINDSITVGNLTIESTGSVAVISGGTLTVNGTSEDRTEYGDVHVMSDGALALGNSADLQVRDFTIDAALGNSSNAAISGQVSGDVNLHINRDAYFQMSFDPRGEIDYGWYDFTVPFEVEVLNGVYDNNMNKLANGPDYVVMNYNEARRASSGKGWGSFTGTMQPGRIYSIGFDDDRTWNTFIFKKKSGSNLLSNGSFTAECSNVGAADDRGWNGLGNGTLQHRELTGLGSRKVQVYNHSEDNYTTYDADEKAYAVGTAFFLQADEDLSSISLTATDGSKALRAPKYEVRELEEFRLTLTAEGEDRYADRMWVSASDEATGEYVIGHDLLKMGTPKNAKVAQMWTVSNDLRLCDIEMPLINDMSQCPLSFFAPNAQTYEIAVVQAPEDATLYLTYNGRVIWSLTASPYTIDLEKGMTEGYGLRIVARRNAPSVATGMDELNVDQDGNRKVLIDNMLYVITPEGAMYSVTGEKVK